MTKYLISFPSEALKKLTEEELRAVDADAHAVMKEAKAAGVYVFSGGIEEKIKPVLVSANGTVSTEVYPDSHITGGFTVLELPDRKTAEEWARKFAKGCHCPQELREFGFDPKS